MLIILVRLCVTRLAIYDRVPLPKKTYLAIHTRVVARSIQLALLNPDNADSRRQVRLVTANIYFISVAVKNKDIPCRNAGGLQPFYDFSYDLRRRTTSRRARRINLDSNHIRGHNEFSPGCRTA